MDFKDRNDRYRRAAIDLSGGGAAANLVTARLTCKSTAVLRLKSNNTVVCRVSWIHKSGESVVRCNLPIGTSIKRTIKSDKTEEEINDVFIEIYLEAYEHWGN